MLTLREIAVALGGEVVGRQVLAPGPHHRASDRSLSVRPCATAPDGFTVHSFAGDDFRTCRDAVKQRLGIPLGRSRRGLTPEERAVWAESRRHAEREEADALRRRTVAALAIWGEAVNPAGTLAARYMASRGLEIGPDLAGRVLRFHPACPWSALDGTSMRVPAMIALMRAIRGDEPQAIQRTALSAEGAKLGRKMLGPSSGAAIKLDPNASVTSSLTIGEGTETVMTARLMGLRPGWALGSAGAIGAFPTLPGIECLSILEEIDGGASASAISECGGRWVDAGCEVSIITPKVGGDLNDAIRRDAA